MERLYSKAINKAFITAYEYLGYPEKAWRKPFFIMVEPTSKCNLKCTMCPRSRGGATYRLTGSKRSSITFLPQQL